jgi:hypothetical protein
MVKKSSRYWWCAGGLVAGVVAGAFAAALFGFPRVGHLSDAPKA